MDNRGEQDSSSSMGSITGMIKLGARNQETGELGVPDLTGTVHQLPCCVKYDGPCAVSHYFRPKPTGVEVDGLRVEEAYFRGRKLQGATVPLPPAYSGFVLGKKNLCKRKASETSEQSSNYWETKAKFGSITYWNHDSLPSQDDYFLRSFHWLSVAEALHKPLTPEDLASASIALMKSS